MSKILIIEDEPDIAKAIRMMRGLADVMETHHKVRVLDDDVAARRRFGQHLAAAPDARALYGLPDRGRPHRSLRGVARTATCGEREGTPW